MEKKYTFIDSPEWKNIVDNIKGVQMSDGSINTLLDFERVLDNADLYAFKNWEMGELVDGPVVKRYQVEATFMWPRAMMPDPRGGKRLTTIGCEVKYKKTDIKVPIKIETPMDFKAGTHYPKLVDRPVWLVHITVPKGLMEEIKQGSIDLADQTIDLEDLDDAYAKDYDKMDKDEEGQGDQGAAGAAGGLGGLPPLGAPAPGGAPPI
jgi:hypothetical protein